MDAGMWGTTLACAVVWSRKKTKQQSKKHSEKCIRVCLTVTLYGNPYRGPAGLCPGGRPLWARQAASFILLLEKDLQAGEMRLLEKLGSRKIILYHGKIKAASLFVMVKQIMLMF